MGYSVEPDSKGTADMKHSIRDSENKQNILKYK